MELKQAKKIEGIDEQYMDKLEGSCEWGSTTMKRRWMTQLKDEKRLQKCFLVHKS